MISTSIILLVLTLLSRLVYRLRFPNARPGDTYSLLNQAKYIRRNGFRIPDQLPKVVLKHKFTYPFFVAWIFSFFSEKSRLVFERLFGTIIELCIMATFIAYMSFKGYDAIFVLKVGLLYLFYPALVRINLGPRFHFATPRMVGQLIYFLHIVLMDIYSTTGELSYLLVSAAIVSLLFFTAKFGVQVLLFFSPFMILYFGTDYLIVLVLSFIIGLVVTKGLSWKVLAGHFGHSRWLFTFHQLLKKKSFSIRVDAAHLKFYLSKVIKGKVQFMSERYFIHSLLFFFPTYWIVLIFYFNSWGSLDFGFYEYWFFASITLFFLTSSSYLWFLGEPERYLEYAILPALIVFVGYSNDIQFYLVLLFGVVTYILSHIQFKSNYSSMETAFDENDKFFMMIKTKYEEGVVLPIGKFWEVSYFLDFPIITYGGNIRLSEYPATFYKSLWKDIDFDIEKLITDFDVKYIVLECDFFERFENNQQNVYDLFDLTEETARFKFFKRIK